MGYEVYCDDLSNIEINSGKKIINTINPHSYIVAKNDTIFEKALQSSDIIIPDGSGIVMTANFIYNTTIKKIAGADIHKHLLEELNNKSGSCFYMGSSEYTLEEIKKKLENEYPNISAHFYSPPFKDSFTNEENQIIIESINEVKPDVLFVGMTAPKQEKWLYENKDYLNFKIATSIGAVFDFYAGTIKRPSNFWINAHLEWLPRFLNEPRRLWRRNFISTPLFLLDMLLYKLKIKK